MTKKTTIRILFGIVTLILIGLLIVYFVWNKPHRDVKNADSVSIRATELYRSFVSDTAKAAEQYTNKVMEVEGEITAISVNQQQQQVVLLKTEVVDGAVNCTMEESNATLKTGQIVRIKGICSGYIAGDVEMDLPGDVFIIRAYLKKDN